jgi:hypothetical protein
VREPGKKGAEVSFQNFGTEVLVSARSPRSAEGKYMLQVNLRKGNALRARLMSDLKVRPPEAKPRYAKRIALACKL